MKLSTLTVLVALLFLAPSTVALAFGGPEDPYGAEAYAPYSAKPYENPYNRSASPTPPLSPDIYGNPHFDAPQRPRYEQPSTPPVEPPAAAHDFNVWKDGKPTLCTATKFDVYCY
jgi:hypothetical protein